MTYGQPFVGTVRHIHENPFSESYRKSSYCTSTSHISFYVGYWAVALARKRSEKHVDVAWMEGGRFARFGF